ncbi:helix-turn-helix domain-containing protein [Azospirillum thermophilum]|uniref:AraC family transcriptional regulator n=1 Tax=Azospirillum thermophilum TaxID=2202148 RepID=A0A2S2CPS0_9PROT|nr:AraC family transcriptional regulator [Azospirillum thermophilum]AWK86523.1 AraC family transcriptional regulator [Azospirillum thermophilum]
MQSFDGYTIHDVLSRAGVPLRSGAALGDGVAVALWERDETADTRYEAPNHHTLSLYLDGGTGIARRDGRRVLRGGGPGSLCVMPQGVTTDWDVSGPVRMLHLYVPRKAFERAVVEGLDADPAAVTLRDDTYVQDALVEGMIRGALLPLRWEEPADRVAASHAARMLVACLATRFTNRAAPAAFARGGLAPAAVRRVREFVETRLESPLTIDDLAAVAGLSPYHFARAFKRATGEAPHGYVLGRRVERAKAMIAAGRPLAEVAAATGFSSQSHLTARFRERVGVTPLAYAKALL